MWCGSRPDVLFIRLADEREQGYREQVVTDDSGRFTRFERSYGSSASRRTRIMMTKDIAIAQAWQEAQHDDLKTGAPTIANYWLARISVAAFIAEPHLRQVQR